MDREKIIKKLRGRDVQAASGETYLLDRELGRGGNGVVFVCRSSSAELVAKIYIPPETRELDDRALERFRSEIGLASRLTHPNILKASDNGTLELGTHRLPFYIMPLAHGTLRREIQPGLTPESLEHKFRLFSRSAAGVAFLHNNGIIHRDLKPENILLDRLGRPLIADLGIAHVSPEFVEVGMQTITAEKLLNRDYYAPEQRFGSAREIDQRADIYALGCILYELVSGIPPVRVSIPDLKVISPLLAPLDPVWRRMTEWEPERRYQAVEDALEDAWIGFGTTLAVARGTAGVRSPDLQRMAKLFRSTNAVHRQEAVDLAVRLGASALPELHSLLGHARRDIRNSAAVALGRISHADSVPLLVGGLYGNSETAGHFRPAIDSAADALSAYPLVERLRAFELVSGKIRPEQARALIRGIPTDQAYDLILKFKSKDHLLLDFSETHLEMLAEIDEDRAWPEIAEAIRADEEYSIRGLLRKLSLPRRFEAVALWVEKEAKYSYYLEDQIRAVAQFPETDARRAALFVKLAERVQQSRVSYEERDRLAKEIAAAG